MNYNMFIGRCNIGREEGEKRMKVSEIYCVLSERYQTLADRAVVAGKNEVKVKKSFTGPKLDANIEAEVIDILNNLNHDKLYEKYNNRCTKKKVVLDLQLKSLKSELSEANTVISKAKSKLTTLILNDADDSAISVITDLINSKTKEADLLAKDISDKEAEVQKLNDAETTNESLINNILNAKHIYANANVQQKKAILQLLIKKIIIRDINDFDIYLRI